LAGLQSLENNFIVLNWDQRGAGTSYQAIDPTSNMTVDQFVADATQLTTSCGSGSISNGSTLSVRRGDDARGAADTAPS
jgi:hypothetical protein